jgi:hypothetical protein
MRSLSEPPDLIDDWASAAEKAALRAGLVVVADGGAAVG